MASTCCNTPAQTLARPMVQPVRAPRRSFWQVLRQARQLARQRRALGVLDAHMLADIGLSREEARREAARPFWDAPLHWRIRP